jgi:hypothetical protein
MLDHPDLHTMMHAGAFFMLSWCFQVFDTCAKAYRAVRFIFFADESF